MEQEKLTNEGARLTVCFDDRAEKKSPITLENPPGDRLRELNKEGFGIFETANSFFATDDQLKELAIKKNKKTVTKRNKEFLARLNEVFGDLDVCKDSDSLPEKEREEKKIQLKNAIDNYCPASVYVITKNGLQPRWWINEQNLDEATQQKYVNVTNGIIEWSKKNGAMGDPVKDVTRVLRKPGYLHQKSEPYLIIEEKGNEKVYTLDELKSYFWTEPVVKIQKQIEHKDNLVPNSIDSLDIRTVVIDVWKHLGHEASFDEGDHLIIDGKATATFKGRLGGNFVATSSSDYPAKGNATTYVAETLKIDTKEAYKWLCKKYNINKENNIYNGLLEPITAEELCNTEFSSAAWMIERLVPENQITVISAAPSSFKTMSALDWALSVASGSKAYGNFNTIESSVLLVNEDGDHKKIIKKRLLLLSDKLNNNFHLLINEGFKIEIKAIENLLVLIKKHNIKFIIFDSFRGIMPTDKDEKEASAVREVINRLRPLTAAGITILIIHHDRKKPANQRGYTSSDPGDLGEMMSGSADVRGAVDCHLAMSSKRDKKNDQTYILVTQTKCREDELLPAFRVLVNKEKDEDGVTIKLRLKYDGEYKQDSAEETLAKAKEAILEFISKSGDKYVWRQVITDIKPGGFEQRTTDKALKALEGEGSLNSKEGKELGRVGSESNRKYYYIPYENSTSTDDQGEGQEEVVNSDLWPQ